MKTTVGGIASSTGFKICDSLRGVEIKSKDYNECGKRSMIPLLIALCVIPFGLLLPAHSGEHALLFWPFWLSFCVWSHTLFALFFYGLAVRQWHGCEHMVINFIGSEAKTDLENLRGASRVSLACSTTLHLCVALGPLLFFLLVILATSEVPVGVCAAACIPLFPIGVFGGSYLFQRFIVTARPTEAQLKEGLEVVETYMGLIKQDEEFAKRLKERGWGWQNEDYQE